MVPSALVKLGGTQSAFDDGTHPGQPWCCLIKDFLTDKLCRKNKSTPERVDVEEKGKIPCRLR